jgi:RNA polymerase sigma factor (sigma-70 family)
LKNRTEKRDRLVMDNQSLVGWAIRVTRVEPKRFDDARQEAQLALIRSADRWLSGKIEASFRWYAGIAILNQLGKWIEKEKKTLPTIGSPEDDDFPLRSKGKTVEYDFSLAVTAMIATLSPELREILRKTYVEGKTDTEIGADYGYSQQYATRLRERAIKELREHAERKN